MCNFSQAVRQLLDHHDASRMDGLTVIGFRLVVAMTQNSTVIRLGKIQMSRV